MKSIDVVTEEVVAEGYSEDEVRAEVTRRLRNTIQTQLKLGQQPNPALLAQISVDHLGALFSYVLQLIYAAAPKEEYDAVIKDFNEYRDFDITARQYQAFARE